MKRVHAIPPDERCRTCAGFGRRYRAKGECAIVFPKCGQCHGTGRRA